MKSRKPVAKKSTPKVRTFVFCVRNGDYVDLQPRRVYLVLPDASADAQGMVRVIDDSGEDYLYPSGFFVSVALPPQAARAFAG